METRKQHLEFCRTLEVLHLKSQEVWGWDFLLKAQEAPGLDPEQVCPIISPELN